MASIFIRPTTGAVVYSGQARFANGSSSVPGIAFAGSTFDGFYWKSAGHTIYTAQGNPALDFNTGILLGAAYPVGWNAVNNVTTGAVADVGIVREAIGALSINNGSTIGSRVNVSGLPTVASGFGTSPSIVAGSTPFAGAVNVGTGGVATTGVINFNGTAFGTAPFVVVTGSLGAVVNIATTSTTQLTITGSAAWTASTIISWIAVSPK